MKRTILLTALAATMLAPLPALAADVSAAYEPGSQTVLVNLPAGEVPTLVESDRPARLEVSIPHGVPAHSESLTYAHGLVSRFVVAQHGSGTLVTLDLRQPLHAAYRLELNGDQLAISLTGAVVAPPSLPPRPLPSMAPKPLPKPPVLKPSPKPSVKHTPKPVAKPMAKPTPKPTAKPHATPTPKHSPVIKPSAKPIAKPTAKPTPHPTPTPSVMTLGTPLPLPQGSQEGVLLPPGATPTAMATTTATPRPTPMPHPSVPPSPKPTPKPVAKLTPKPTPRPSATPEAIHAVRPAGGNHVHVGALNYDEDTRFLMVPITGRVVPIYTSTANPPRLIIDLPDTVVGATQRHTYQHALVTQAIAYQHTPTETRIILTFARAIGENWVMKQTPKNLILIFDRRPIESP